MIIGWATGRHRTYAHVGQAESCSVNHVTIDPAEHDGVYFI